MSRRRTSSLLRHIHRAAWLLFAPGLIINVAFGWYPLILGFIVGFQDYHLIRPPVFNGFSNFSLVLQDPLTKTVFQNTVYYTALSLALTFLLPIFVAILLMEMSPRTIRIMMILWFVPIAGMASLVIWRYFYNPNYGLFNAILNSLGLPGLQWLNDSRLAMLCLVLPGLIMYGPGLIYVASLQGIPNELYEAAELDGAGFWTKLRHISLPRLRPIISMMLVLAVIGDMQVFMQPWVMTGGGPANATRSVVMHFYELAFRQMQFGKAQAIAILLFLSILLLTVIQQRFFRGESE